MSSVRGEGSTYDSQLSALKEADTRNVVDVPRQHHPTVNEDSQIPDAVNGLKIDVRHSHSGTAAVMQTTARAQPNQLRLRRVETKSVGTHPRLDALDARGHPHSQESSIVLRGVPVDLEVIGKNVHVETVLQPRCQ